MFMYLCFHLSSKNSLKLLHYDCSAYFSDKRLCVLYIEYNINTTSVVCCVQVVGGEKAQPSAGPRGDGQCGKDP